MSFQQYEPPTPRGAKTRPAEAVIVGVVGSVVFVVAAAIGHAVGVPGLAFWVAGAIGVGYGTVLLRRNRQTPGAVLIAVGVLAALIGFGPELDPGESIAGDPTVATTTAASAQRSSASPVETTVTGPDDPERTAAEPRTAREALPVLEVKGRGPKTGYLRDLFGWNSYDFDRNGCDQRNDVLKRDMVDPEIKPGTNGCRVEAGWLQDRYSGVALHLTRDKVDIDHVVALSNAWQMGAAQWTDDQRREFANDPLNLVATTQQMNRGKGDGDAATWLPPKNRCDYVARQTAVKLAYGLAVTKAERNAINDVLDDCPDQPLPAGDEPAPQQRTSTGPGPERTEKTAPTSPPSSTPPSSTPPSFTPQASKPPARKTNPPAAKKSPTSPPVTKKAAPPTRKAAPPQTRTDPRFGTCKEAISNGYGPYVRDRDPEYHWYRDQDKDGIVCER